jgi:hypothetical protein
MLPRERRLPTEELKEAEKLVALQVNNKLMRDHFEEKTGKKIILKDISNIISKVNLSKKSEDLESLVNKLKKTGMIADCRFINFKMCTFISVISYQSHRI